MTLRRAPLRARLGRLAGDARGAATVEFALVTLFFFFVVMGGMDIAGYFTQQVKLGEAVSAASTSAFQTRTSVDFASLPTYVAQASRAPAGTIVTVTARCNGNANCTNVGRTCVCLSQAGAYTVASCGSTCVGANMSNGSTAGYYLTVTASYPYRTMLLPQGVMAGKTVRRQITTRLQ